MALFTQRRGVRRETDFDRKIRAFLHLRRTVAPSVALVASFVICAFGAWCFVVVLAGWPRVWAGIPFVVCGLFSPAFVFVLIRELWRFGWDAWLFLAALVSVVGFVFWCVTTYLVIHPSAA
jgi:hypothetical protein